jgi:hypothetical protein
MSTTSARTQGLEASAASRSARAVSAVGAAVAVLVNTGLWLGGRAADASFMVTPLGTDLDMKVGLVDVVLGTLVMFAAGSWLLARAARRSRAWAGRVLVAAALFAALSSIGPLTAAHETSSGALLAAMHLSAGAVFMVTAPRIVGRAKK